MLSVWDLRLGNVNIDNQTDILSLMMGVQLKERGARRSAWDDIWGAIF